MVITAVFLTDNRILQKLKIITGLMVRIVYVPVLNTVGILFVPLHRGMNGQTVFFCVRNVSVSGQRVVPVLVHRDLDFYMTMKNFNFMFALSTFQLKNNGK
jgi:hypothetical protein